MKIKSGREQNRQSTLSDQDMATALSVRPKRWAAAVEAHGASQVLELNVSSVELKSICEKDDQLDWLKSVLHEVEGMPGKILQAHLIERRSIKDLAQALNCSRASLRIHLQEGLGLLRQWAQRDGLIHSQTRL